jgi:hypothetical protein
MPPVGAAIAAPSCTVILGRGLPEKHDLSPKLFPLRLQKPLSFPMRVWRVSITLELGRVGS